MSDEKLEQAALDRFGSLLMEFGRDMVLNLWRGTFDGTAPAPTCQTIHARLMRMTPEDRALARALVPEIVDSVLHYTLWMLEQYEDEIRVSVEVQGRTVPNLVAVSDGLSGELNGPEGWLARFSQEHEDELPEFSRWKYFE